MAEEAYLRSAGVEADERVAEAVGLVAKRRRQNGRWPLHDPHPDPVHFDMEGGAGLAAGTHSAPHECWTGIQHKASADAAGRGLATTRTGPFSGHYPYYGSLTTRFQRTARRAVAEPERQPSWAAEGGSHAGSLRFHRSD